MLIRCPECTFTREVDENKISPRSAFATCPKCSHRFRFRTLTNPAEDDLTSQRTEQTTNQSVQKEAAQQDVPLQKPAEPDPDAIWSALEDLNKSNEAHNKQNQTAQSEKKSDPERAAMPRRPGFLANTGSIPWEYRGGFCTPKGFIHTMQLLFTKTPAFFAGTPATGSLIPALVFALLMSALQFAALIKSQMQVFEEVILSKIQFSVGSVIELSLLFVLAIIIVLIVFAGAINFIAKITVPTKVSFNITFKIVAYSMAALIFSLIPQIGLYLAEPGSILLCAIGIRHAYKLSWGLSLLVISPRMLILLATNI